jgi:cell division protein FtsL
MKRAKKIFLLLIASIVLVSTIFNIKNQFFTLKGAKQKNAELEVKIDNLIKNEQKLKKQIEDATSSATIERQAKELLGLGTENDAWLKLTPEKKTEFYQEVQEVVEVPKIRQWLNLFTQ